MINFNLASSSEYVPRVEHNNRFIKKRVRAACYQLPYQHLQSTLMVHLVVGAARNLNCFPA